MVTLIAFAPNYDGYYCIPTAVRSEASMNFVLMV